MTDRMKVALGKGYLGHSVNEMLDVKRMIRTFWQVGVCCEQ